MSKRYVMNLSPLYGLIALVSIALASAVSSPAQALYDTARCSNVEIVSHRGLDDATHSENSLSAFRNAVNNGGRTLETDLRLTSDHQWVLMHDTTVDRTTTGTGTVASKTLEEIKAIKTNDGRLGGIPTLQELLAYVAKYSTVKMQLEIKDTDASNEDIAAALSQVDAAGLKNRAMIISFSGDTLLRVKAIDSTYQTGLISSTAPSVATTKKYGTNLILKQTAATEGVVASMRKNGVRVYAWTVNTKTGWSYVVKRGVNGITTDRIVLLRNYCRAANS